MARVVAAEKAEKYFRFFERFPTLFFDSRSLKNHQQTLLKPLLPFILRL
jgi:hypothetical protein